MEQGAQPASTPAAAVAEADGVIAMLRDDEASRSVWLDPQHGALAALAPAAWVVESSTLTVAWVRELANAVGETGRDFVDAPVLGSRPQADEGQLVHLIGGSRAAVDRVTPVLAALGHARHHAGPAGSGAALKLIANTLFGIQVAALAELAGRMRQLGLNPADAFSQLGETPVMSQAGKGAVELILAGRHDPLFPVELVAKDFSYAVGDKASEMPVSAASAAVFDRAGELGLGNSNLTAVARLYADSAADDAASPAVVD